MDLAPKLLAVTVFGGSACIYLHHFQIERSWRRVWAKVTAVEVKRMYINPNWTTSVLYTIEGVAIDTKLDIHARSDGGIIGGPYLGQRLPLRVHPTNVGQCVLDIGDFRMPLWLEIVYLLFAAITLYFVFVVF
jgi:hypothetical protein